MRRKSPPAPANRRRISGSGSRSSKNKNGIIRQNRMNLTQLLAIPLLIIAMTGCQSSIPVTLSRNREMNRQAISRLIPPGMSLAIAEKIMRANGFDWVLHRNQSIDLRKGDQIIGTMEPMSFALCTRHGDDTTWQTVIILNQEDLVEEVDVTSQPRKINAEPVGGAYFLPEVKVPRTSGQSP